MFLFIFLAGCSSASTDEKELVEGIEVVKDDGVNETGESVDQINEEKQKIEVKDITDVDDFSLSATSVLVDDTNIGFNYEPEMVSDKDFSTGWCVTSDDDAGKITFQFNDLVKAEKFGLVPGFARDEKIYFQNSRIKRIKLIFDGENEEVFELKDVYGMQFVKFDEREFKTLDFVIEGTFEGSKYEDTCIAEIDFQSEYVLNEDAGAALNYYKKYKADFALRPYDIVSGMIISDLANDKCGKPVKTEFASEDYYPFSDKIYVNGLVNEYGKEGDVLRIKWYQDQKPIFVDGAENLPEEWVLLFDEEIKVHRDCKDALYAPFVYTYPGDSEFEEKYKIWPIGPQKVQFFRDGKMIENKKFSLTQ